MYRCRDQVKSPGNFNIRLGHLLRKSWSSYPGRNQVCSKTCGICAERERRQYGMHQNHAKRLKFIRPLETVSESTHAERGLGLAAAAMEVIQNITVNFNIATIWRSVQTQRHVRRNPRMYVCTFAADASENVECRCKHHKAYSRIFPTYFRVPSSLRPRRS